MSMSKESVLFWGDGEILHIMEILQMYSGTLEGCATFDILRRLQELGVNQKDSIWANIPWGRKSWGKGYKEGPGGLKNHYQLTKVVQKIL